MKKEATVKTQGVHRSWAKYDDIDKEYFAYIAWLEKQEFSSREIVFNFPVFVGHVNLGRYLMLYDLYNRVRDLAGDIADIGTYKGASFLFFAKLVALFERAAPTQVHGFDWFKGMKPGARDDASTAGHYITSFETLVALIRKQGLSDIAVVHKMDLTKEFDAFLATNHHMRFKLSFVDCGIESVLNAVIGPVWEKTMRGGIVVFDHYNCESSPSESKAIEAVVGRSRIQRVPYARQPTAYVVKE